MSKEVVLCRFRVNSKLKSDFSALCKSNHVTPSFELRDFMSRSLGLGRLDYQSRALHAPSTPQDSINNILKFRRASGQETVEPKPELPDYQEDFDLDTTFNFKLDPQLKEMFSEKFSDLPLSSELKRYMSYVVRKNS